MLRWNIRIQHYEESEDKQLYLDSETPLTNAVKRWTRRLNKPGKVTCKGRCCRVQTPDHYRVSRPQVDKVCWWPLSATTAAVEKLEMRYCKPSPYSGAGSYSHCPGD